MTASAEVRRRLVREMRLDLVKPWKRHRDLAEEALRRLLDPNAENAARRR